MYALLYKHGVTCTVTFRYNLRGYCISKQTSDADCPKSPKWQYYEAGWDNGGYIARRGKQKMRSEIIYESKTNKCDIVKL